jgi:glucose/arabinose dehydrogenase
MKMLLSLFSRLFFIQFVFITIFCTHRTNGANVSFIPQPIHLTVADLPEPYATPSYAKDPNVIPVPENPTLYVPDGFTVKLYMSGLRMPRYLLYTPTGDILVSEPDANRISCLIDNDGDGYPDERLTFADASNGLNRPYGMAFASGYFYVGSRNSTRRYSWTRGSRQISGIGELVMEYDQRGHWTRTVVVSPNLDRIYIGIGSASNVNADPLPRASVQVANLNGDNRTTFAYGLRNPVGLAFHPITKDLYVACQERDEIGDDLVPDFFTRIQQNDFYGWPYAYMSPNFTDPRRQLKNGINERPDLVSITQTPDVLLQAHSAVLDTLFYTGTQFPNKYHNGAFAALHGSWNRNNGAGYNIVFIPFDNTTNRPMGYYEDFVTGFLVNPSGPDTFGRPVGLLVLKDGSLLFTEDGNDKIYQVQYTNNINIRTNIH